MKGWYSVYLTSPIRPKSITQQLSRIFAFLSRTHRGHMLKPFYIDANTRTFRSMLVCVEGFTHSLSHMYIYCILKTSKHTSTCTDRQRYAHTHTQMQTHVHMPITYIYICDWKHIHPSRHGGRHTSVHAHIHPHAPIHECMHICMHARIHAHMHTYMHRQTDCHMHTYTRRHSS